jgi:type I restriction enzyme R subunit
MENDTDPCGISVTDFDPHRTVQVYRHHLPHWRQDGVIYFVTFRLADSIPAQVLEAWEEDRRRWLAVHGITGNLAPDQFDARYRQIPEGVRRAFERETLRRIHVELDRCHGACLLRNRDASDILANALHFHHGKRLYCGDFIIMPNHVHWLLLPCGEEQLEQLTGSVKRFSAVRINRLAKRSGTLWQAESFDHIVRNARQLVYLREYIRDNPAKAGLPTGEFLYYRADWLKVGGE